MDSELKESRFEWMIDDREESFLATGSWTKIKRRIGSVQKKQRMCLRSYRADLLSLNQLPEVRR